jgi:predicted nuclease with TOPRIM domain
MSEINKKRITALIQSVVTIVIGGVIMMILQSSFSDSQQVKEDIIRLDREKADIEYVNEKTIAIKKEQHRSEDKFSKKLDDLNKKTDRILELMIEQRN